MRRLLVVVLLALSGAAWAQEPVCTDPFAATYDAAALLEPGGYYLDGNGYVFEALGVVPYLPKYPDRRVLMVRNVFGRFCLGTPSTGLVYLRADQQLVYGDCPMSPSRPQGTLGKLPAACWRPSLVVRVGEEPGTVIVSTMR